jgi:D-inositol-3-phosphate glycosyltransferase
MDNAAQKTRKVAMFCHDDPLGQLGSQESGGQAVYLNSLIKELDKKGWAVDTYTRLDSPHKKTISLIGKRSRLIRLKGGPMKYISRKLLFDFLPQMYENFLEFIGRQNPYLLFHGHYWDGGNLALRASMDFCIPFIENFHSLGKVGLETKARYSWDKKNEKDLFDKRFQIEDEIIKGADKIITLSASEKTSLENDYSASPEKVVLVPGGVDLRIFTPRQKSEARKELSIDEQSYVLLFVGRMEWRKGIGTLIHAAGLLKNDIPNLKVIVVGGKIYGRQKNMDDFNEYQRLAQTVKNLGLENVINFVGCADHNRLPFFYSAADVFVVPSYYEPFGLVALESMACRTPVVASEVGGLTSIIENNVNGLLFRPRNPAILKEKILQLYNSRDVAELMARNAEKMVKNAYSWQAITKKISDIYEELIKTSEVIRAEEPQGQAQEEIINRKIP